ncbi:MAG: DUF533 domain-containing protein [Bdellovibrionota bacterium]
MINTSDSQFQLWRAAFAVAYADGKLADAERNFLSQWIAKQNFTDDQKKTLAKELMQPAPLDSIIPLITEPRARGHLVYITRLLCHADGVVVPEEKDILKKLNDHAMAKADLAKAMRDAAAIEQEIEAANPSPIKQWWDALLHKL